jgi:hypothetical protein
MPTRATEDGDEAAGGSWSIMAGMAMEKRVLSWGGEGSRSARAGMVGPSLATVWVVVWTGMAK